MRTTGVGATKNGKIRPSYVHLKRTDTSINPSILKTKSVHIYVHLKKRHTSPKKLTSVTAQGI